LCMAVSLITNSWSEWLEDKCFKPRYTNLSFRGRCLGLKNLFDRFPQRWQELGEACDLGMISSICYCVALFHLLSNFDFTHLSVPKIGLRNLIKNAQTPTTCPGVRCRGSGARCTLCWASPCYAIHVESPA
jgi:hypothetical protein